MNGSFVFFFLLSCFFDLLDEASWTPHDIDVYLRTGLTMTQWHSRVPTWTRLPYWRFLPHPCAEWQFPNFADVAPTDKCALADRRAWCKYDMMSSQAVRVCVDTVALHKVSPEAHHPLSTDFIVVCTWSEDAHADDGTTTDVSKRPIHAERGDARFAAGEQKHKRVWADTRLLPHQAQTQAATGSRSGQQGLTTGTSSADALSAFVNDTFDLDFLKNTYDGQRVRILQLGALARRCSVSHRGHPLSWETCQRRNFKYRNRGFAIEPFYVEEMRQALGEPPSWTDVAVQWNK